MKYTEVRTYAGTPPLAVFASKTGTPVVLDTTNNKLYYLAPGDVITALAGGGGGTGTVTHTVGALTNHALVIGSGVTVDDEKTIAAMTDGQLVVGATGADPAPQTMSGDATFSSTGVLTLKTGWQEPAQHTLLGGL